MGTIIVKDRQTLLDIALQTSGSVEAVVELARANGLSITDELTDGNELATAGVADATVVSRYEIIGIFPATEASNDERNEMAYEGIGFMGIGIDFIVS